MKYCTSCGNESQKKICMSCGIKINKEHKFCAWCGKTLNDNASICTKCKMKVKPNKILTIILLIIGLGMLFMSFAAIISGYTLSAILIAIAGTLSLPFVSNYIKKLTFDKRLLKIILKSTRAIIIIVFFVLGISISIPSTFEVTTKEATDAAVVVFHEEVKLKNTASFVLNNSKVTYLTEPYQRNSNLRLVEVSLDYSAQNGFGGTNRKDYLIQMLFDVTNGNYYRIRNKTLIK